MASLTSELSFVNIGKMKSKGIILAFQNGKQRYNFSAQKNLSLEFLTLS